MRSSNYETVLNEGVQITSTSTPALNGTYTLDLWSRVNILSETTSIIFNSTFTDGQTSHGWPDITGAIHVFPTTTSFMAFATALGSYADALNAANIVTAAGGAWVAPPQPGAIA